MEKSKLNLNVSNGKKYKVGAIWDNIIYKRELEADQQPEFYYLFILKRYFEKENIWKLFLTV